MNASPEDLGIDPDNFQWEDLALCQNMDTELFFRRYENDSQLAIAVDELCLHCPVIQLCYNKAKKSGQWGVWAGWYWAGSNGANMNKIDKARNLHKTDAVVNRLKESVGVKE